MIRRNLSIRTLLIGIILLVVFTVYVIGCGGGTGGVDNGSSTTDTVTDTPTTPAPDPQKILISGTLSDTPVLSKPIYRKSGQDKNYFYRRSISTWGNAVIQAIDEYGVVVATTTSDSMGKYSFSVPPGNNYFLRASLGNLVLKSFIENASSNLSDIIIDPASSAKIKVLCDVLGNSGCGEPGTDVSTNLAQINVASTFSIINSSANLPELIRAITQDIASNYDSTASVPAVGSAGIAGTSIVDGITDNVNGTDMIPPTVIATAPVTGSEEIPSNSVVTVTFSEAMTSLSITTGTFTITTEGNNIAGTVTYAEGTATFTPSADLVQGQTYTATIKLSVTDNSANQLGTDYLWTFTTKQNQISPEVLNTVPINNATGIAINSEVTATFSEEMTGSDFTIATFIVNYGMNNIVAGTVVYTGMTATFTPDVVLEYNTAYTVTINGVVKGSAGDPLGSDYVWTFTTNPDGTLPTVSDTTPPDAATDVAINRAVTATFSEEMSGSDFTLATFTVNDGANDIVGTVTYSGTTVTFSPDVNFIKNTTYTATINGIVGDLIGNTLGTDYVWTFTTGVNSDTTPPAVSETSPLDNATDIEIKHIVTATFSESMTASDFTTAAFTVNDGTNDIAGTVTYNGTTAIFTPSSDLSFDTIYTATISSTVTDLANNPLPTDYFWSFTTGNRGPLVSDINFSDINLRNCVLNTGVTYVLELTNLNCNHKNINDLSGIGNLAALTDLNLSFNKLTILPSEIGNLTALTTLNLSSTLLTILPPEIGNLTALTILNLYFSQLTILPPEIGNLAALTELTLSSTPLTVLPPEIGNLTALTELNLSSTQLTILPPEIGTLTALTELTLSSTQLTILPSEIGNLTALTRLTLSHNQLTVLPPEIGNLTALPGLTLSHNQLTSLPPEIGNLTTLGNLDLSNNQLTGLPVEIGNLTALSNLNLSHNQLTVLPPEIGNLTALTELNLSSTPLTSLPPEIGNLTALTKLNLSSTQLTSLPPEIGNLTALTRLTLSHTLLMSLPSEIGNLTALTGLILSNSQLTGLPPEIGNLTTLTWLDLSDNQLTILPLEIGNLTALSTLNLSNNLLTTLPSEIGNLTVLRSLDLSGNQLTSLPPEIGNLTTLGKFVLSGNQLTSLPSEIGNLTALSSLNLLDNKNLPCADITNFIVLRGDNVFIRQNSCIPPEVTAPDPIVVAAVDSDGAPASNAAIQAFLTGATAKDSLGEPITVITHDGLAQFPIGITTVTFSATDSAGNTGRETSTVTVADQTPPVVTAPAPIIVAAVDGTGTPASNAAIQAFLTGATATDNVDVGMTVTNDGPVQFLLGVTTVTFDSTDAAGNTGTVTSTVNVTDQTPAAVTAPAPITVAAVDNTGTPDSDAAIQAFLAGATATDNVDVVITVTNDGPAQFLLGITTVTFSATDVAGNTGTATSTVTVEDQTPPVITAPTPITVASVDSTGTPASNAAIQAFLTGATATDNVDVVTTVTNDGPAQFPLGVTITVTFSSTDAVGNTGTATSTVTIMDQTPPVVTAPAPITVAAVDGTGAPASNAAIQAFLTGATATDNVDVAMTVTNNGPAQFSLGVTTVTFDSTDAAGNTGTVTSTVNVTDQTPAAVTAPAPITVAAVDGTGTPASNAAIQAFLTGATATDNVDVAMTVTHDGSAQFSLGITTVTFSATDVAGNTGTATSTVTVGDQGAPVVTVPTSITVEAVDGTGTPASDAAIQAFLTAPTATDIVDGPITVVTNDGPTQFPIDTTTVTFSATDSAGNIGTATSTVTVSDRTPPAVTGPTPITVAAVDGTGTPASEAAIQTFLNGATATDSVDSAITVINDGPVKFPLGVTIVTFNSTDAAGNTGSATSTVTVTDQTPPVVTGPTPITVAAVDGTGTPDSAAAINAFLAGATATDNVDGAIAVTNDGPAKFLLGVTVVTFNSTDAKGNTGTATSTVTVTDQTPPIVNTPSPVIVATVDTTGTPVSATAIQTFLNGATATDLVDGSITIITNDAPAKFSLGVTTTVTFTSTDAAGNIGTATSTVTVADQTPPVVTAPSAITVAAVDGTGTSASDAAIQAFLTGANATDNIDGAITVTNDGPAQFPIGTTTVTFSATDVAGNTGTATSTVTVEDQTLPVVTAPAPIIVPAIDGIGTPAAVAAIQSFLTGATATDSVDGAITVITNDSPAQFPLGVTTTVTFSATDAVGNTGTATSTVTVTDLTPPAVTAPTPITVATVDSAGTPATDAAIQSFLTGATATDNVDGAITVTHDAPAQFSLDVTTTVTFSATDSAGNTGTATSTITITDQAPPVVTAPAPIIVAAVDSAGTPASDSAIQAFLTAATATDIVDGVITGITNDAPVQFPMGTTTVTFSATDVAGNTGTATSTVTVPDLTPPVVTALTPIVVAAVDGTGTPASDAAIQSFLTGAVATDIVDGATTVTNNSPAQFSLGVTTVNFSSTDAAGNTGTATSTVTVTDQTPPVVTGPTPITIAAVDGTGTPDSVSAIQTFLNGATATDNVDGTITGIVYYGPAQFPIGTTTVTFEATDVAGNIGSATSTVTITDQTLPIITAPTPITVAAVDGTGIPASNVAIQSFLTGATATDNVDGAITVTSDGPAQFQIGTTTVTFSATDVAGNTDTATSTVTVTDQTPPLVTAPSPVTVAAVDGTGTPDSDAAIQAFLTSATATDNVDGAITVTNDGPAQYSLGVTTTVTFISTDNAGNTGTATSTITVTDQTLPVVTAPTPITVAAVDGTGTPAAVAAIQSFLTGATATDIIDGAMTGITNDAPAQFPMGTTTVTFSATDVAGNTGTATSTVTVPDLTPPVVTAPAPITVAAVDGTGTPASNAAIQSFLTGATATDIVDGAITVTNDGPGQFSIGITTVTFSATDVAGNMDTATSTVTVTDQTPPVVTAPAPIIVAAVDGTGTPATDAAIQSFLTGATATDNVDGVITVSNDGPTHFSIGVTTVTFSSTDAFGNTGTATATVTVTDQTLPVVTAPAPITVAAVDSNGTPASDAAIQAFLTGATATDIIDGAITVTNDGPAQFPIGTTTVTFSATDAAGNTGTATATVIVEDHTLPVVIAPAPITVAAVDSTGAPDSDAAIAVFLTGATATDNVDGAITVTNDAPAQFPIGTTIVTFSATDATGNTGTETSTVTVN